MTRFRSLLAATLALVAISGLLVSCSSESSEAALTIDGVSLPGSEFRDELQVLLDHPEFARQVFNVEAGTDSVSSVDPEFAARVLSTRAVIMAVEREFDERDLTIDDAALAEADESFGPELLALVEDLPADYRTYFREWNAKVTVLGQALGEEAAARPDEVSDDEVRAFYDDFPVLFQEVCARHILVTEPELADTLFAELQDGADFIELANEHTTDESGKGTGGDLGCTGPGRYVPEFESAVWGGPVGEVLEPVISTFGHHVILVDSRGPRDFEEVEAEVRSILSNPVSRDGRQLLGLWVQQRLSDAEIDVADQWGTWDTGRGLVVPPAETLD